MSRLLTISQAAEMLGVSIVTLRRWEQSGKIQPMNKPNKKTLNHDDCPQNCPKTQQQAAYLFR